jgi:hypothetical protein
MRSLKIAGLVFSAFLLVALPAAAAGRFRGDIGFVPAGRLWYGHDPFFYGPFGYNWPYGAYPEEYASAGEVKLSTNVKDAEVFINGAFAGKASKLKTMWLNPDAYTMEVRAPGYASYTTKIYVVPGKTLQVHAELTAEPK